MNPSLAYLLLAFALGVALFGLLQLIARAIELAFGPTASLRRLARRREHRLARGEDRYFEELRAIDAAIERNEQRAEDPGRQWLRWPLVALLPAVILMLGLIVLDLAGDRFEVDLGPQPAWFELLRPAVPIMLGLLSLVDARTERAEARKATRFLAWLLLGIGVLMLVITLSELYS